MTEIEVIAALGIFFGCLSRAILPFLKKKYESAKEGQQFKWESRYVWTIIFTLFVAMITTMLILPTVQMGKSLCLDNHLHTLCRNDNYNANTPYISNTQRKHLSNSFYFWLGFPGHYKQGGEVGYECLA